MADKETQKRKPLPLEEAKELYEKHGAVTKVQEALEKKHGYKWAMATIKSALVKAGLSVGRDASNAKGNEEKDKGVGKRVEGALHTIKAERKRIIGLLLADAEEIEQLKKKYQEEIDKAQQAHNEQIRQVAEELGISEEEVRKQMKQGV